MCSLLLGMAHLSPSLMISQGCQGILCQPCMSCARCRFSRSWSPDGDIAPVLMAQVPAPSLTGLWHHQLWWKIWLIQTLQLHIVQLIKLDLHLRDLKNVKFVFHQCWLIHRDDLCYTLLYHCCAAQAVSGLLWAGTTEDVCRGITESQNIWTHKDHWSQLLSELPVWGIMILEKCPLKMSWRVIGRYPNKSSMHVNSFPAAKNKQN